MFKCIALLKRRQDLSKEAFIHYYETHHAPLIRSLFPEITLYRRNYLNRDEIFEFGGSHPIDFDVVTEIHFADRAAYAAFLARSAEPEVADKIASDEMNVFERSATRMFTVQTYEQ